MSMKRGPPFDYWPASKILIVLVAAHKGTIGCNVVCPKRRPSGAGQRMSKVFGRQHRFHAQKCARPVLDSRVEGIRTLPLIICYLRTFQKGRVMEVLDSQYSRNWHGPGGSPHGTVAIVKRLLSSSLFVGSSLSSLELPRHVTG